MLRILFAFFFIILLSLSSFSKSAYTVYQEGIEFKDAGRRNKAIKTLEEALELAEKRGQQRAANEHSSGAG